MVFVHWLPSCYLHCLHTVHSDFLAYGQSSMDEIYELGLLRGRPFGGVAAFVMKSYKRMISLCSSTHDDRVICLEFNTRSNNMLVFVRCFPVCDTATPYIISLTRLFFFIFLVCFASALVAKNTQ